MPSELFSPLLVDQNSTVYKYFTGESWSSSQSGKTVPVYSPIDLSLLGSVQAVTKSEVYESILRVKNAQPKWARVPLTIRIRTLAAVADLIRQSASELTDLLIREIGKPKEEALGEVLRTADLLEYYTREAQSIHGDAVSSDHFPGYDQGSTAVIDRVPVGVILAIAPFNYPLNLAASKIAPAILMGNSVVFKPPTQGSISGLFLTQLLLKAGVPGDIITCITGEGREIGDILVTHPDIAMIAFTGSTGVGAGIAQKTGMKPLLFECGGNNPVLVLLDANIDLAAKEIVRGAFSYAGQRCTGIKYVLGTRDVLDTLIGKVKEQTEHLVHVGDPRNDDTKLVGPIISEKAAEEILAVIHDAVSKGAKLVTGGTREKNYIQPTILTDVTPNMPVVAEETFGPVVAFITVENTQQAIQIMNESRYGLQAAIFTEDEGTGMVLARDINVGTVQINGAPQRGPDHFPFLGVKQSGVGVQGVKYSLQAMSRIHSVVLNKPR